MNAIKIEKLVKEYKLYETPKDRVKEAVSFSGKKYHKIFSALKGVSFEVEKGETVGIIGTNGAGKSTLLKIITSVLTPTSGEVNIEGKVSALLELGAGFNAEYSGIQNVYLNGRMMGYSKKEMDGKIDAIVEFADIGDFIEQPVKTYSSGMFARLAFAVAINVEPDILIVDEALSVGDLFFQNKCFKKFEELKEKNVTILFVSHDIASVRQMCSRVLWLEKGKQKMFTDSNTVCDLYMDEKRMTLNRTAVTDSENKNMEFVIINKRKKYPGISGSNDRFENNKVKITSAFFTDCRDEIVSTLEVDKHYQAHVILELNEDMENLIVGFVLENNKGLPLFDINNYINQQETIKGKKEQAIEVVYNFKLPRILKGVYLLGTAVAQGTQESHEILSWLHGVMELEVINMGYNSSYIEIPAQISIFANDVENICYY